jgi:hypothetical protein
MRYEDLGKETEQLGSVLQKHGSRLQGETIEKAATTFAKAVATFRKKLDVFLAGTGPGIQELQELFKSPQAKALKGTALSKLGRSILRRGLAGDTPAKQKADFLKGVKESGKGDEAVAEVRRFFRDQAAARPVPSSDEELRTELHRLGGLSDEDLTIELETRYSTLASLKKLAKANAIPTAKGVTAAALQRRVIEAARRMYTNVRS